MTPAERPADIPRKIQPGTLAEVLGSEAAVLAPLVEAFDMREVDEARWSVATPIGEAA